MEAALPKSTTAILHDLRSLRVNPKVWEPDSPSTRTNASTRPFLVTPLKSLAIVWMCAIAGAVVGALAGWVVGAIAPGYYYTVFDVRDGASIDPVQTGVGLGLTQGLIAGFVGGMIMFFVLV